MKAPASCFRLAGLAVMLLALAPVPDASAAIVDITVGDSTFRVRNGAEGNDVFMDSWRFDSNNDNVYSGNVFPNAVNQGQGFWVSLNGGTTTAQNSLMGGDTFNGTGTQGDPLTANYALGDHQINASYWMMEAGGVATITETFTISFADFFTETLSFIIWSNADLGSNPGDDTGVFANPNTANALYTQTDGENAGRSYTMQSSITDPSGLLTGVTTAVTSANNILTGLKNSTIPNLVDNNPGPGNNVDVGFQYDFTIPGAFSFPSVTIQMVKTFTTPAAAPEPASLALLAGGGLLLLGVSRRRRG